MSDSITLKSLGAAYRLWKLQKAIASVVRRVWMPVEDLNGTWTTYFAKEGRLHEETVHLWQLGRKVSAFVEYGEKNGGIVYKCTGRVQANVFAAIYEPATSEHRKDRGSFTLSGGGKDKVEILKGFYSWMDDDLQRPNADSYVWIRQGCVELRNRVLVNTSQQIHGSGVLADKDFFESEIIHYFEGRYVNEPTAFSLTFDGKIVEPRDPLRNLNHSCSPNAEFSDRWLYAKRTLKKGEEITIDYTILEGKFTKPFDCKCGAANCRQRIG